MSVKIFGPKSNLKTSLVSENFLGPQKFGQEKIWSKKREKIWGSAKIKKSFGSVTTKILSPKYMSCYNSINCVVTILSW